MLTFAVGDIHGCYEKLVSILAKCESYAGSGLYRLVFLGDYIDRGPSSYDVVELLAARRVQQGTFCLMGNHETYLLDFLKDPATLADWQRLGGLETLMSYGLVPSRNPSR